MIKFLQKSALFFAVTLLVCSCSIENDRIDDQGVETLESIPGLYSKSSANPVGLIKSSASATNYRGLRAWSREFTVKVKNLAYDKKVSIYHETVNGDWVEIPLTYNRSISDEYEIWDGFTNDRWDKVYDDEFVVKYEVNGTTYWDNNAGNNYVMDEASGALFGDPDLAVSIKSIGFFPIYEGKKRFSIVADVKNIAPEKDLQVVYTTDKWNTFSSVPFEFKTFYSNGYNYAIPNPNPYGIERWSTYVDLDGSVEEVEYAVVYKVNGQEYWDNNYTNNYTTKKITY